MRANNQDDRDRRRRGGVLADGERLRVPMTLMDGRANPDLYDLQRAVVTDASGDNGPTAFCRPGYRIADGVRRDDSHYRAYDQMKSREWQQGATSGNIGQRDVGGQLKCIANDRRSDARDHEMTMDQIYAAYDRELSEAWRDGGNTRRLDPQGRREESAWEEVGDEDKGRRR
jgi:hypothetical protein